MGIPSGMDTPATYMPVPCTASSPGWYNSKQTLPPPFCSVKLVQRWCNITSAALTQTLRTSYTNMVRASGATALLLGNIDSDTIWLIGRWRSNETLRHLHVKARRLMQGHATTMVAAWEFNPRTSGNLSPLIYWDNFRLIRAS